MPFGDNNDGIDSQHRGDLADSGGKNLEVRGGEFDKKEKDSKSSY